MRRLVGLSMVEVEIDAELGRHHYRVSQVVAGWLEDQGETPDSPILQKAARYQRWVFDNLQGTLTQGLVAYEALGQANLEAEAADLALGVLIPHFDRRGLYHSALREWLPGLRENQDPKIRAVSLNWTGNVLTAVGQYDEALKHLERSLAISRQIGDRAGFCVTVFNMGHIYLQNEGYQHAVEAFVVAYQIASEIGYAQALWALDDLAKQIGGSGLEYWERLAQQVGQGA